MQPSWGKKRLLLAVQQDITFICLINIGDNEIVKQL